jgi:hypothetical protein
MSDREAAQKAYQDMQKSNNPSAFDTMGAFNNYYAGWNVDSSKSLALDMGRYIPATNRAEATAQFNQSKTPVADDGKSFWQRASSCCTIKTNVNHFVEIKIGKDES